MTALTQAVDEVNDHPVDVSSDGGVVSGGRLLSVAEIQQALRELRARSPRAGEEGVAAPTRPQERCASQRAVPAGAPVPTGGHMRGDPGRTAAQPWGDVDPERWTRRGDDPPRPGGSGGDDVPAAAQGRGDGGELATDWVTVVAAHAGAGASTVALAISDAAAASDRRVHLVDSAHPRRSGLIAAASAELGTDATGGWRRGARGRVTIDRRVADAASDGWPTLPVGEDPAVTVLDLGLLDPEHLDPLAAGRTRTVVVCRPTVPGVRLAEQVLSRLVELPVVVAAVGPRRWPGEVPASLGPRLRALWAADRVVTVPTDRRLEVTGLTDWPLPKPVLAAGRVLLELLENAARGTAAQPSPAPSSWKGPRR